MTNILYNSKANPDLITSYNPATKKPISTIAKTDINDLETILEKANIAQKDWSKKTLKYRSKLIIRVRKEIVKNIDDINELLAQETGKTNTEAFNEIFPTLEHLKFISKNGPKYLKIEKRKPGIIKTKRGYINYIPYGTIGIITPWNFPFFLSSLPIAESLLAGNAVIYKPSELTPLIGIKIHEIFLKAGIPDDLFQIAIGDGNIGASIVRNPKTNMINFIGSVEVGKEIATVCGKMLKPVLLELGGKDPMIVLEDANLERAANAAIWGGMTNCGQICISVERVYVVDSVADEFIELIKKKIKHIKFGPNKDQNDIGSLVDDRQHAIVLNHINNAKNKGADISIGGEDREDLGGYFIAPTVIENVNHDMKIMQSETFGPEISIMRVKDEKEAINMANDTTYGLSASVFSRNKKRARKIAKQIQAGSVCINDVMASLVFPSLPFGGMKNSGIGRQYGIEGIRSFSQIQAVCEDRLGMRKELWWYPMNEKVQKLFRKFVKIYY